MPRDSKRASIWAKAWIAWGESTRHLKFVPTHSIPITPHKPMSCMYSAIGLDLNSCPDSTAIIQHTSKCKELHEVINFFTIVHGAEMWWCFSLHFCAPEETRIDELHVPSLGQCLHAYIPGHSATLKMNSNNLFDNVNIFHELLMKKMVGQGTCTYKENWLKPSIQTI